MMLHYNKSAQPKELTELQATPGADWSSHSAIQRQLMQDQGYLCAYCQRRIRGSSNSPDQRGAVMHVEHWLPQSTSEDALRWSNLLAVCPGNPRLEPGGSFGETHCDTSRGNQDLFLHPVVGQGPNPLTHLAYTAEGKAIPVRGCSNQARVQQDIDVLRLNAERLKRGRTAVGDALRDHLIKKEFSESAMRRSFRQFEPKCDAPSPEYCEVARYFVSRWAKKKNVQL